MGISSSKQVSPNFSSAEIIELKSTFAKAEVHPSPFQSSLLVFLKLSAKGEISFEQWEQAALTLSCQKQYVGFISSFISKDVFIESLVAELTRRKHSNDRLSKMIQIDPPSRQFTCAWDSVFERIFFGSTKVTMSLLSTPSELLEWEDIFALSNELPHDHTVPTWQCLYSTKRDGASWTLFQSKIENAGSSLIVIQDAKGNVFGGFASKEWLPHPNFYGDSDSFLFHLKPSLAIYHSTGINTNFQYLNSSTASLINGFGMGGQLEYFGLFIDQNFEIGHTRGSPSSTTYGNPPLSSCIDFVIEHVEVWMIKKREIDESHVELTKKSILDVDPAASAMLEIAGKNMYSKDLPRRELGE